MSVTNGRISARMGIKIAADGVSGDLQKVFGSTQKSHAWYFESAPINLYSKYKPFRSSIVFTDHYDDANSARAAALRNSGAGYAISFETALNRSLNYQNPYWTYARPRGANYNELYRAQDFEQYYHNAAAPMLPTNVVLSSNQQILVDFTALVNKSADVELSMEDFYDFASADYLGIVLWDATRKFGYILVTDMQLREAYEGFASGHTPTFYKSLESLPFEDEDVVEFFYCTYPVSGQPSQGGEFDFMAITAGVASNVFLMASDSTHGHCLLDIIKFNLREDIAFANLETTIGGSWNAGRTAFTFNSFSTKMPCTYAWRTNEGCSVSWRMVIGLNTTTATLSKTQTLSAANASQYYNLTMSNGTKTFDIDTLRDYYDYVVPLYLYGRLSGSDDEVLFVTIRYNVQTGTYTYE